MPKTGNSEAKAMETRSQRYEREKAVIAGNKLGKQFVKKDIFGDEEVFKALKDKIYGKRDAFDINVNEMLVTWILGKDPEMTEDKVLSLSDEDMRKFAREFLEEVDSHPIQQPYIDGIDAEKVNQNAAWYGSFIGGALKKISVKAYPDKESINTSSGIMALRTRKHKLASFINSGIENLPRVFTTKKELKEELDGVNPEGVSRNDFFGSAIKKEMNEGLVYCFHASRCFVHLDMLLENAGDADQSYQFRAMNKLRLEMEFMNEFAGKQFLEDKKELGKKASYYIKSGNRAPKTGLKGFSDEECLEILDTPMDILKERNPLLWKKSVCAMNSLFPESNYFFSLKAGIKDSVLTQKEQDREKAYAEEDQRKWGVMNNGHTLEKIYRALTAMGDAPEALRIKEELRRGENMNFSGKDAGPGGEYIYRSGMDMLRRLKELFIPVSFIPDAENAVNDLNNVLSFNRDMEIIEIFKPNLRKLGLDDLSFLREIVDKVESPEREVSDAERNIADKIRDAVGVYSHLKDIKEKPDSNWGDVYSAKYGELEDAIYEYFEDPKENSPLNDDFMKAEEIINPAGAERLKKRIAEKELQKTAESRPVTKVLNLEREEEFERPVTKVLNLEREEEFVRPVTTVFEAEREAEPQNVINEAPENAPEKAPEEKAAVLDTPAWHDKNVFQNEAGKNGWDNNVNAEKRMLKTAHIAYLNHFSIVKNNKKDAEKSRAFLNEVMPVFNEIYTGKVNSIDEKVSLMARLGGVLDKYRSSGMDDGIKQAIDRMDAWENEVSHVSRKKAAEKEAEKAAAENNVINPEPAENAPEVKAPEKAEKTFKQLLDEEIRNYKESREGFDNYPEYVGKKREKEGFSNCDFVGKFKPYKLFPDPVRSEDDGKKPAAVKRENDELFNVIEQIFTKDWENKGIGENDVRNVFLAWCIAEKNESIEDIRTMDQDKMKYLTLSFKDEIRKFKSGTDEMYAWYGNILGKALKTFEGMKYPEGKSLHTVKDIHEALGSGFQLFAFISNCMEGFMEFSGDNKAFLDALSKHVDPDKMAIAGNIGSWFSTLSQRAADPSVPFEKRLIAKIMLETSLSEELSGKGLFEAGDNLDLSDKLDRIYAKLEQARIRRIDEKTHASLLDMPMDAVRKREPELFEFIMRELEKSFPEAAFNNMDQRIDIYDMGEAIRQAERTRDAISLRYREERIAEMKKDMDEARVRHEKNKPLRTPFRNEINRAAASLTGKESKVAGMLNVMADDIGRLSMEELIKKAAGDRELLSAGVKAFDSFFSDLKKVQDEIRKDSEGKAALEGTEFYSQFHVTTENGEIKGLPVSALCNKLFRGYETAGEEDREKLSKTVLSLLLLRKDVRVDFHPVVYYADGRVVFDSLDNPSISNPDLRYPGEEKKTWNDRDLIRKETELGSNLDKAVEENYKDEQNSLRDDERGREQAARKRAEAAIDERDFKKIQISGEHYTREQFLRKTGENGWKDKLIEDSLSRIISAYDIIKKGYFNKYFNGDTYGSALSAAKTRKHPLEKSLERIIRTGLDKDKLPYTDAHELLSEAYAVIKGYLDSYDELAPCLEGLKDDLEEIEILRLKENRPRKKEEILKSAGEDGWDDKDTGLFEVAADAVYDKKGRLCKELDDYLFSGNMVLYENGLGGNNVKIEKTDPERRENALKGLKKIIESIPEEERTEAQDKLLEIVVDELSREEIDLANHALAVKRAEEADKTWKTGDKDVFYELFFVSTGMSRYSPYAMVLDELEEGVNKRFKTFDSKDRRESTLALNDILRRARHDLTLLPDSDNKTRTLKSIDDYLKESELWERMYFLNDEKLKRIAEIGKKPVDESLPNAEEYRSILDKLSKVGAMKIPPKESSDNGVYLRDAYEDVRKDIKKWLESAPEKDPRRKDLKNVLDMSDLNEAKTYGNRLLGREPSPEMIRILGEPVNHLSEEEDIKNRRDAIVERLKKDLHVGDVKENVIEVPPANQAEVKAANREIPENVKKYLQKNYISTINHLAEEFDTKKRGRLFNWNSGEYNAANKAIKQFRESRDALSGFIKREAGQKGFEMGLQTKILDFKNKERILKEKLSKYIRKVTEGGKLSAGAKGIDDMTQDAGAARLAAARELCDWINGEDREYMDTLVNEEKGEGYDPENTNAQIFSDMEMEIIKREAKKMRKTHPGEGYGRPAQLSDEKKRELLKINYDRQKEEGRRQVKYTMLHKDKYRKLKNAGEKNAHRRAAREARAELNAEAAPEAPEAPEK